MNTQQKTIEILQQLLTAVHQLRKGTYYECDVNAGKIIDAQLEAASKGIADLFLNEETAKDLPCAKYYCGEHEGGGTLCDKQCASCADMI